jgi:hypothetical protein
MYRHSFAIAKAPIGGICPLGFLLIFRVAVGYSRLATFTDFLLTRCIHIETSHKKPQAFPSFETAGDSGDFSQMRKGRAFIPLQGHLLSATILLRQP